MTTAMLKVEAVIIIVLMIVLGWLHWMTGDLNAATPTPDLAQTVAALQTQVMVIQALATTTPIYAALTPGVDSVHVICNTYKGYRYLPTRGAQDFVMDCPVTATATMIPTNSPVPTDTPIIVPTDTATSLPTETQTETATETATSTPTDTPTPTVPPTPTAPISVFIYDNPPPPTPTALVPTTLLGLYVAQGGSPQPGAQVQVEQCQVSGSVCDPGQFELMGVQTMGSGGILTSPVAGSFLIEVTPDYYYRFTVNGVVTALYIPPGQTYVWQELDVP